MPDPLNTARKLASSALDPRTPEPEAETAFRTLRNLYRAHPEMDFRAGMDGGTATPSGLVADLLRTFVEEAAGVATEWVRSGGLRPNPSNQAPRTHRKRRGGMEV